MFKILNGKENLVTERGWVSWQIMGILLDGLLFKKLKKKKKKKFFLYKKTVKLLSKNSQNKLKLQH